MEPISQRPIDHDDLLTQTSAELDPNPVPGTSNPSAGQQLKLEQQSNYNFAKARVQQQLGPQGQPAAVAYAGAPQDIKTNPDSLKNLSEEQRAGQMVHNFENAFPPAARRLLMSNRSELGIDPADVGTAARYLASMDINTFSKIAGLDRNSEVFQDRFNAYTDLKNNLNQAIQTGNQELFNRTLSKCGGEAGLIMTAGDVARREQVAFNFEHQWEWSPKNTMNPLQGKVREISLNVGKQIDAYSAKEGEEKTGQKIMLASMDPISTAAMLAMYMAQRKVKPITATNTGNQGNNPGPKNQNRTGQGEPETETPQVETNAPRAGRAGGTTASADADALAARQAEADLQASIIRNLQTKGTGQVAAGVTQEFKGAINGAVQRDLETAAVENAAGEGSMASKILKGGAGDGLAVIGVAFVLSDLMYLHYDKGSADSPFAK